MRPNSDVDIALLLPEKTGSLIMSPLRFELESLIKREIEVVNLRLVSTVLQKEISAAENRIYCADEYTDAPFQAKHAVESGAENYYWTNAGHKGLQAIADCRFNDYTTDDLAEADRVLIEEIIRLDGRTKYYMQN